MKLDKRSVERLTSQSDERLWSTLRFYAGALGVEMPKNGINDEKMRGLRKALEALTDEDLARLNGLVDTYQNGKRGRDR